MNQTFCDKGVEMLKGVVEGRPKAVCRICIFGVISQISSNGPYL